MVPLARSLNCLIWYLVFSNYMLASEERLLSLDELAEESSSVQAVLGDSGEFTFWFPPDPDELILPISAGIVVDAADSFKMDWLRKRSPWKLLELPAFGLRFGNQMVIVVVPWPHYARLIVDDRVGVQFALPPRSP